MKLVEQNNEILNIKCTYFDNQSFCEYNILFEHKGFEPIKSKAQEEGIRIHNQLYEDFEKKANVEIEVETTEEILQKFFSMEGAITRELNIYRPLGKDVVLKGRCDEVQSLSDRIIVIEYKPSNFPYIGWKRQAISYGYIIDYWLKKLKIRKDVFVSIANRDTGEVIWEERLSKNLLDSLEFKEHLRRIHEILVGKREPIPTTNIIKCLNCKFRKYCEYYKRATDLQKRAKELKEKGLSERKIAKELGLTRWKIRKLLKIDNNTT